MNIHLIEKSNRTNILIGLMCILWWIAVAVYWIGRSETEHLLFLCDITLLLTGIGFLINSRLLITSQFIGMFAIQVVWNLDFFIRLLFGISPFKAATYMFSPTQPAILKGLSTFHIFLPVVFIYGILKIGYHYRGVLLQTALATVILILSYFTTTEQGNTNWVLGPFHRRQELMHPVLYLCLLIFLNVLMYFIIDLILRKFFITKIKSCNENDTG